MNPVDCRCLAQILVCVNDRPGPTACCQRAGGLEVYLRLKDRVQEEGLVASHWVTRTACLGFCHELGATVAIHREGKSAKWFSQVKPSDLDELWREIVD